MAIEGCTGPARGRIVFEAKASRLSKPRRSRSSTARRTERNADYAVLVVPDEERIPARMHELREYGGDKLVVCFDPEDGSTLSLEVAYKLARARVLMARGEADGVDAAAIREEIERATGAMGDVLRVKQQLTARRPRSRRAPRSSTRWPSRSARSSPRSSCCSRRASRRRRRRRRAASEPAEAECAEADEGEPEPVRWCRPSRPGPARLLNVGGASALRPRTPWCR